MLKGLKNYGLWVSLASTILLVLQALEVGVDVGKYNELVNILLAVLVALGVVSNPKTENKWYGDDKK
jgi:uncharacterized membrane protein